MAQIKPTPVHITEYYKAMREAYTQKKNEALTEKDELMDEVYVLHDKVMDKYTYYIKYGINLMDYKEFVDNEYIDGTFYKVCKGAYLNKKDNYKLTSELHQLLKLAEKQYKIYELNKSLNLYNKVLSTKATVYTDYLRTYFNEVHKKMIIEGCAYHFGHSLGDVIINRVKLTPKKKALDYKATKDKKAEIIARGGRIYNKEEAEWCERNGIEYNGEDYRVYLKDEYFYEIFMTNQMFTEASQFLFTPLDYRSAKIRGKSNEDLIKECNGDLIKLCETPVDLRTKIHMCVSVDKMLYTNFIRNENQTSYKYDPADW